LLLSASATWLDTKLKTNACDQLSIDFSCLEAGNTIVAPAGSRLPVSPQFKGNLIARYSFSAGVYAAHLQGALSSQSSIIPALDVGDAAQLGDQPAYATFDLSTGIDQGSWSAEFYVDNLFDERGQVARFASCKPSVCTKVYVIPSAPRTIGLSFSQKF
jgi:outer membrane receptor protein involved in Fe transport